MLLTMATAAEVQSDFIFVLVWGAIVVVGTIYVLGEANKGSRSEVSLATAIKIGIFSYLLLMGVSYRANYGNFIEAEISANEVGLHFAGNLYNPVVLERRQISEVLFGFPGKGKPQNCYLKFVTGSGATYRSATMDGTACKELRQQILGVMQLPN